MNVFNLIYGISGTGKSEYLYKDIDKKINKFKNIYIIVPEQSNLNSEKKLFDITGRSSFTNVEVLTLSKIAHRISDEIDEKEEHLSKVGKAMIIYDLLAKNKKSLKFLGKSDKNIETVEKMFTELKKYNISIDILEKTEIIDDYTSLKIDDIILLYKQYQERIANLYIDENDVLTILARNISKSNMFENSAIYFDDFFGFTPQQYDIFEEIAKKCEEINLSICIDNIESDKTMENDIFYFNKVFAKKILAIVEGQGININFVNLNKNYRLKNEELVTLENVLIGKNLTYDKENENIELFLANNMYSEVEYIAKKIYDLVKKENYKYREIAIVTNETEEYAENVKSIFSKYDIPIFIDKKKDLNQNILIKYILSLLNIFSDNWSYESIFNYLKIGLSDYEYSDICMLENYCLKWGIKGSKWYKNEFNYETANDIQEKLEKIRKDLVSSLLDFRNQFNDSKNVKDLIKFIYVFFEKNRIVDKLNYKINLKNDIEIYNEYNSSYKIVIDVLQQMVVLFGDDKITFDRFKDLFIVGINSSELGKISATQDQVILGDIDKVRNNNVKILFVIGFNDGKFPSVEKNEGYLNDIDRRILKESSLEFDKDSIESMYEEQFNIYRILVLPEERLYISYCSSDKEGKTIRPSIILKKITRTFKKISLKSDILEKNYSITNKKSTFEEALEKFKKYLDGEQIEEKWKDIIIYFYENNKDEFEKVIKGTKYSNLTERIEDESIKKLYGDKLITTITRLESYRRCPFAYHLTYGLKIKKQECYEMSSIDTGSFMHEVIDKFFEYLEQNDLDVKIIENEQIFDIINIIIDEILSTHRYGIFQSSPKFRIKTKRLKKVVTESIQYIVYTLKNSEFKQLGHEISFGGEDGKYSPIEILLDNGNKVEITGKIDRIDVGKLDGKQYVRIIDYKSQSKNVDLKQVEMGLQIQLITYLDALTEKDDFDSAGILYLGLIDNIVKANKNLDDEEIKKKLKSNFKMKGLVLADVNIVRMMDNKLVSGTSDIIPVYLTKDGNISAKRSSVMDKEEFDKLQEKVKNIIKEISSEILEGNIEINPYKYKRKTGCDYCEYKSICSNKC